MNRWMTCAIVSAIALCMAGALAAEPAAAGPRRTGPMRDIGLIVSVPSVLSEIESYRAGLGVKFNGKLTDVRVGGDVLVTNADSLISFVANVYLENHFWNGPISPYWGGGLSLGMSTSQTADPNDASTLIRNWTVPMRAGGILGVEFFLLDFLSVFVEYELGLEIDLRSSSPGRAAPQWTVDYKLDSQLGNNGCIGIVIYFDKIVNLK